MHISTPTSLMDSVRTIAVSTPGYLLVIGEVYPAYSGIFWLGFHGHTVWKVKRLTPESLSWPQCVTEGVVGLGRTGERYLGDT